MNKTVSVVVTYNRKELLRECLTALINQEEASTDIFLVDNCSTDGTKEYIEDILTQNSNIIYYKTEKNIGGAGGFNIGIREAYGKGYEYFWLMDDDSVPDKMALHSMLLADQKLSGNYGFICSNVKWTDNTACKMNIPDISKDWMNHLEYCADKILPVTRATFVGFFLKREMIEKVGLPVKEFFIWSDDANYSLRIIEQAPCYVVLDSIITHKMNVNSGASIITDTSGRNERYFYAFRNRFYNARMTNKKSKYYIEIIKTTILILLRSKYKMKKLFYMYKGFFAGFRFKPPIEFI